VLTSPFIFRGRDSQALQSAANSANSKNYSTLKLRDGRLLEYKEYGDPQGIPVLFLSGFFHSRQNYHPTSRFIEQQSLRLIMPERPGFGRSPCLPKNASVDCYAQDIDELMAHLAVDTFFILAETSAAKSGFICANFLPERVRRMAVVSAFPDPEFDVLSPMSKSLQLVFNAYRKLPGFSKNYLADILSRHFHEKPDNFWNQRLPEFPPSDRAIVQSPLHRAMVAEAFANAYRYNSRGALEDVVQRTTPWDIDVRDCSVATQYWHGELSIIVAVEAIERMAGATLNAEFFPIKNVGHFLLHSHWDEILAQLIKAP
jgi:pimeloyl-ACP methyl ester carboxylesterase